MNNEHRDIVIFTGQSGIKHEKCIDKLANARFDFKLVSIDKTISEISSEKFIDVLGMPPRIQESLWTKAFEQAKKALPQKVETAKYTFFTSHACYYHQGKTEFICPVNLSELIQLKDRTKMIIVLLDDAYDIYRRLLDTGQMYDYIWGLNPLEALRHSITNLSNILTWRESEIAFSRKIAQLLNVPMYTISVKHPAFVIARLISVPPDVLKILYLSHPISSIRKRGVYPRLPEFYTELSYFIRDILKSDNTVLFVPDTIDELRIGEDNDGAEYIPELSNGWPLPFSDQWLCETLPQKLQRINPLNPRDFNFSAATDDTKSAISSTLRMLTTRIIDQINSRDRTLVEQSKDGVVVFRPYWAASVPSGVEQEMMYNFDLRELYGETERKTYMLTTYEDLGKCRINQLFTLVEDGANIEDKDRVNLQELCQKWLAEHKTVLEFYNNTYNPAKVRKEIESALPPDYEFSGNLVSSIKGALAGGKMLQKAKQRDKGWGEIFKQLRGEDPLSRYTTGDCTLLCNRAKFEEEAKNFIEKVVIGV